MNPVNLGPTCREQIHTNLTSLLLWGPSVDTSVCPDTIEIKFPELAF